MDVPPPSVNLSRNLGTDPGIAMQGTTAWDRAKYFTKKMAHEDALT
jgi:hypothetical protein